MAARSRAHARGDAGTLNLHHDLLARAEGGRVDLGYRRRGERLAVEPGEHDLQGRPEILLDDRP